MMDNNKMIEPEELIVRFLEGSISFQEEENLYRWLKESKENEQLFFDYSRIWLATIDAKADFEMFKERINSHQRLIKDKPTTSHSKPKRRVLLYFTASSVAVLLLFLLANIFLFKSPLEDNDILLQANSTKVVDMSELKDIQLILSEEKIISLPQKESTVKYTSAEVVSVNEENEIPKNEIAQYNELITPLGKRSKLLLPDGTEVYVNSKTRVVYPSQFAHDKREIYVDGEIYLNVVKDEKSPFIVRTNESSIQVLGTSFNVSTYEDESALEVVLISGSVEVKHTTQKSKSFKIKPNERLVYEGNETTIDYVSDTDKYTSWTRGFYVFEKEPMSQIVKKINKYYGAEILLDSDAAQMTCSGKLDLKDSLKQIMQTLENTVPIKCSTNRDGTYSIKKK